MPQQKTLTKKRDMLKDLNPAQRQAVTHKTGPLLIIAGAGYKSKIKIALTGSDGLVKMHLEVKK